MCVWSTTVMVCNMEEPSTSCLKLRHLCSAFDHNRTLLLEDVEKKLDKKRNDLMNHVSLVWVRLDDALDAHEGTIRDPLEIR